VAELAGIGTGWYTFLEQGRDVRPSEGALRRIARALQLQPAEEKYLLRVALEPALVTTGPQVVQPELSRAIRCLTTPALVLDCVWDVLDWNEAASAVYDIPYLPSHNLLRVALTPEFRALVTNWEQRARQLVGAFRAQNAARLGTPRVTKVVDDLSEASPQFRAWWAEQAVREENSGISSLNHPFVGRLRFNFVMLGVLDSPGLVTTIYSCCGEQTRRNVDELIRQLREGTRGPDRNLWKALTAKVCGQVETDAVHRVVPADSGMRVSLVGGCR
jgi:hypothetical protein